MGVEVESWVRKNPSKVLKNLKSILTAKQSARKVSSQDEENELSFTKIAETDATD